MNETMLALLGFVTIITVIVLLLKNVTVPSLAFISEQLLPQQFWCSREPFPYRKWETSLQKVSKVYTQLQHYLFFPYYSSEL